jgi:hypothetical protein
MQGTNKIIFNRMTMMEVVEEYLNRRALSDGKVKVTGFDTFNATIKTFEVLVEQAGEQE